MRPPKMLLCLAATAAILALPVRSQSDNVVSATQAADQTDPSWPSFMLLVGDPTKKNVVPMGIDSKRAIELAETFYPNNLKLAVRLLRNVSSELGETEFETDAYYLSKYAITNEQYYRFVQATGHRFPFHWWKFGKPDSFDEYKPKVKKAYPDLPSDERGNAPLYYWESNWKSEKLPYAIPKDQDKLPVVFVSYDDALAFAAWAGMRLPTEVEWTLAGNGGERREFVYGPEFDPKAIRALKLENRRDCNLRPAGSLGPEATGPYGHQDMVGQVWEWVSPLGFEPQTSQKLFDKEYEKLKRDKKYGPRLADSPGFRPEKAIAKGGSFLSFSSQDYVQSRLNNRAPLLTVQTLESLGFRVAKSKRPAYDMTVARKRIDYPQFMPGNVEMNMARQIGIERYALENQGMLIKDYRAVSLVPVDFLSLVSKLNKNKLRSSFQLRPALLSILLTTEEFAKPAIKAGVYGVYFRPAGIPKDLHEALKRMHKILAAEAKAAAKAAADAARAEKAGKKPPEKKDADEDSKKVDPKRARMAALIRQYGYSDDVVASTDVQELIKHVYLRHLNVTKGESPFFKISTATPQLVFRDKTGKWIDAIPCKSILEKVVTTPTPSTVTDATGKTELEFHFGVVQDGYQFGRKSNGREYPIPLKLELKKPWN